MARPQLISLLTVLIGIGAVLGACTIDGPAPALTTGLLPTANNAGDQSAPAGSAITREISVQATISTTNSVGTALKQETISKFLTRLSQIAEEQGFVVKQFVPSPTSEGSSRIELAGQTDSSRRVAQLMRALRSEVGTPVLKYVKTVPGGGASEFKITVVPLDHHISRFDDTPVR